MATVALNEKGTVTPALTDKFVITDVSDTAVSANGATKQVLGSALVALVEAETTALASLTDIASGTLTARADDLDLSGGSDGYVLTVQADGSAAFEAIPAATAAGAATADDLTKLHALTATAIELNYVDGVTSAIQTQLDAKAPLASPTLTGTPAAPTAAAATSTTQIATTAFVTTAANLKADLASPTFTGTPAAPTATAGTSTTQLATTAFVTTADNLKAPLASPTFTGTPAAPTAAVGTDTTQVATTAFVQAAVTGPVTINAQTGTTYTAVLSDAGKVVTMNNASANQFTIPDNSAVAYPTGTVLNVVQIGAGVTTVKGNTDVVVNGAAAGSEAISARYQGASLLKIAANAWVVSV